MAAAGAAATAWATGAGASVLPRRAAAPGNAGADRLTPARPRQTARAALGAGHDGDHDKGARRSLEQATTMAVLAAEG